MKIMDKDIGIMVEIGNKDMIGEYMFVFIWFFKLIKLFRMNYWFFCFIYVFLFWI